MGRGVTESTDFTSLWKHSAGTQTLPAKNRVQARLRFRFESKPATCTGGIYQKICTAECKTFSTRQCGARRSTGIIRLSKKPTGATLSPTT